MLLAADVANKTNEEKTRQQEENKQSKRKKKGTRNWKRRIPVKVHLSDSVERIFPDS